MYRQILVDARDQDYQRIVWFDTEFNAVQDFRLQTVTYGTASAPYLALRVIKQLIRDEDNDFPLAAQILQENIYVDDVLFGAEEIPVLRQAREQVCSLLSRGKFTLRKWASNVPALLSEIPVADHGLANNRIFQENETVPILGISWIPNQDALRFQIDLPTSIPNTKRQILSMIAKIFNPLGWITPVTVSAKIFMQQLWRVKLEWDDVIPTTLFNRWESIFRTFDNLDDIYLSRWTNQDADSSRLELHGFADASNVAYAAVVYLRVQSLSGDVTMSLLTGKSKVAPLKPISIPRLELLAAVLLSRLLEFVQLTLNIAKYVECYCWSNSTVVLHWLSSHPSRWKTFVANRVADVQTRLPNAKWHHVPTLENPADCASRGVVTQAIRSLPLWWHGPTWLRSSESNWPAKSLSHSMSNSEEEKRVTTHATPIQISWDLSSSYSSIVRQVPRSSRKFNCLIV